MCWMPAGMNRRRRGRRWREVVVEDRDLDVDRHAAERVTTCRKPLEVDLDVVLDVEAVQVAEDRLEAVVAARVARRCPGEVGRFAFAGEAVDLARVDAPVVVLRPDRAASARRPCRGQLEHHDLVRSRVDRDRDHRVGVEAAALLVDADEQDVQALLAVPSGTARRSPSGRGSAPA
jgi:hypothetical protein